MAAPKKDQPKAEGVARGKPSRAENLHEAFIDAVHNFRSNYGRSPECDVVQFRGSFFTGGALIEIWEDQ